MNSRVLSWKRGVMRAAQPGIVFARAADQRQADPLSSDYARLFAGVPFAG
jgi:hypothetical protein